MNVNNPDVNNPVEMAAYYAAKELELDAVDGGRFAHEAVLCLRAAFDPLPMSEQQKLVVAYSGDGWISEHYFGGMGIRNLLRRAGLLDDGLPDGNWDDYYRIVVRRALKIDPEPEMPKRIMGDDRLAEWRDFAASCARIFHDPDLDMDPQELVDHIDGMQELLNLEVKTSQAGFALRAAVDTILTSTEVDCWETFEKAAQAFDDATGWEPEDPAESSEECRKIQRRASGE